ncbi:low molecular weight phosphatase family protein [Agreia sp. PsM10]|uniref:arsenate reductase/protein-tyrosine-phosphatase family protein n=1 Tax=Agreia sp. PsM10 TaxID=3030533 RepID=UPI00263A9020|nr:low molecular weight phosphatase family protein [Agreia sp. PsM10]MDN4641341.1 low molecular weight phosphatase family protein [Agreia sp. PsM10]
MSQSESSSEFVVLFVCTGNICRSPIAEQLFRAQTGLLSGLISTSSAGTYAMSGQAMTEQAAALSRRYNGDPSQHRASELTLARIKEANLIVTMTRQHRAEVVSMLPRASRKTFTLRELDRLIGTYRDLEPEPWDLPRLASVGTLDAFILGVAAKRGFSTSVVSPTDDDILDPYRRSQEVYDEAGLLISQSIRELSQAIITVTSFGSKTKRDELSQTGRIVSDQSRSAQRQRGNDD